MPPKSAIYGGIPDDAPGALDGHLLAFAEDLRSEGVAIGTSEILDAFEALSLVEWTDQDDFKEALATTLAKSNDDRRVFELVFDRFFFRATEAQAARKRVTEAQAGGRAPRRHQPRHAPPADRGRAQGRLGRTRSGTWPGSRSPRSAAARVAASSASTSSESEEPSG